MLKTDSKNKSEVKLTLLSYQKSLSLNTYIAFARQNCGLLLLTNHNELHKALTR